MEIASNYPEKVTFNHSKVFHLLVPDLKLDTEIRKEEKGER